MAECSQLDREYKMLFTEMNVSSVDENLYVRSSQNRDIPCET